MDHRISIIMRFQLSAQPSIWHNLNFKLTFEPFHPIKTIIIETSTPFWNRSSWFCSDAFERSKEKLDGGHSTVDTFCLSVGRWLRRLAAGEFCPSSSGLSLLVWIKSNEKDYFNFNKKDKVHTGNVTIWMLTVIFYGTEWVMQKISSLFLLHTPDRTMNHRAWGCNHQ